MIEPGVVTGGLASKALRRAGRAVSSVAACALVASACTGEWRPARDATPQSTGPSKIFAVEPPACDHSALRGICSEFDFFGSKHLLPLVSPEEHNQQKIHITPSGRLRYDVRITFKDDWVSGVAGDYRFDFRGYGWREIPTGDPLLLKYTTVRADIHNPRDKPRTPYTATLRIVEGPKGRYRTRGIVWVYARLITVKRLVDPDTQQPL